MHGVPMRNLARVILAVVVVFVVAVTAMLVIRSRSARVESPGPLECAGD